MKKDYISKHDLAHEFFPDAERHVAVNHLMRCGYRTKKRYFSPVQREIIYDFIGDP